MRAEPTRLEGVLLIRVDRHEDERGWFLELANDERYRDVGLADTFVQTNVSRSSRGVLRGMHYQSPHAQGKLVSVIDGAVFDAVIDVRAGSPSFGEWYGCELSAANGTQLWVPPGFAHGFLVLSDVAIVHYSCTQVYRAEADRAVAWNDPDVAVEWPFPPLRISAKDAGAPRLRQIPRDALPRHDVGSRATTT